MKKLFNLNQVLNFGKKFNKILKAGDVMLFKGDLGTGKSTIIRKIIKSFVGSNVEVNSPTFNVVQIYETKYFNLWHFDLYRINNISEIQELGIEEAFNKGVSLIEWPEHLSFLKPKEYILISLQYDKKNQNKRLVNAYATPKWKFRIKHII